MEKGPHDPEIVRKVAQYKRLAEKWTLDAAFRDDYKRDPVKAIAATGFDISPEAFDLLIDKEALKKRVDDIREGRRSRDDIPESYLLYRGFIREKLEDREKMRKERCVPAEPHFKAWRQRQEKRCWMEMGPSAISMIQAPLMFELTEGCSVGCPFCGLASKGLQGIFRYTEDNAALWRETLSRIHTIIGDAAGCATCYYASEGLDNPDYEKFLADYFHEFGIVPQTTTAVSTRDIERTRALLRFGEENHPHIDRFSVLNADMRDKLFESFTPEELILVELLPQFPEAPGNRFAKAGRNRDRDNDEVSGTIACASGFVINMPKRTIRLMTPFVSDRNHPTGEWNLEKCSFTSAEDLEFQIRRMIETYMPLQLDLEKPCGASCDIRMELKDDKVWVGAHSISFAMVCEPVEQAALDELTIALKERKYTGEEIMERLPEDTDVARIILLLNMLWDHGLIDQVME
jgi:radical SAM family RiPP maturation amino acid epimerase